MTESTDRCRMEPFTTVARRDRRLRLVASTLDRASRRVELQRLRLASRVQPLRKLFCRESSLGNAIECSCEDVDGNEVMGLL
jgi:hypothetical protein